MRRPGYKFLCVIAAALLYLYSPAIAEPFLDGNALVEAMREFEKAETGDKSTDYMLAWKYVGYVIGVYDTTEADYDIPAHLTGRQVT
jgi:hypothetical protein